MNKSWTIEPEAFTEARLEAKEDAEHKALAFHPGSQAPLGKLVEPPIAGRTPDVAPASEPRRRYPLQELYAAGKLGISEGENRRHWHVASRLRKIMTEVKEEGDHDQLHYSDLVGFFETLDIPRLVEGGGEFRGITVSSGLPKDAGSRLSDELEFEDTATIDGAEPVDCSRWNPYRDLPQAAEAVRNKQILALAAEILGKHFLTLTAVIERHWTLAMVGETEGYALGSATASACGTGMVRSALRSLDDFFVRLDRAEAGEQPMKSQWPLVGTPLWIFDAIPNAWTKGKAASPANDNAAQASQNRYASGH